jgi:hypothetical protein
MYFVLKPERQKELINLAIQKAGSYRALSKITTIPRSTLNGYLKACAIPESNFNLITNFLNINNREELISQKLEDNWKQIKGGKKCVDSKIKKGTFEKDLKLAQKNGALKLKKWHKSMKEKKPREYHLIQYEKFKKIGGYKFQTNNGEKVRNLFEKEVADIHIS